MKLFWTKIVGSKDVMLITKFSTMFDADHKKLLFYTLSVSHHFLRPRLGLAFLKEFGESAMTTITSTFGRLWFFALPLVVLFAVVPTVADAQTRIGSASSVTPEASGSVGGTLSAGSGVHANETIKTGSSGQAGLQFNDQSNLTVGHSSQVRLDKFVYDPNKGTGSTVIEATRGTFRFSTGAQNGGQVKIKTPYGTLGVRG
jgi:hypothetical protein